MITKKPIWLLIKAFIKYAGYITIVVAGIQAILQEIELKDNGNKNTTADN